MIADGVIEARPAQEDETAMRLLRLLSIVSRRRWPKTVDPAPAVGVPPPKKKKAAAATAAPKETDDKPSADAPAGDAAKS
jgi:coenzyme F420 hydrogenase subunit beta